MNVMENLSKILQSNHDMFRNVELVRDARVPIIRTIYSQFDIEIDISFYNMLVCIFYVFLVN